VSRRRRCSAMGKAAILGRQYSAVGVAVSESGSTVQYDGWWYAGYWRLRWWVWRRGSLVQCDGRGYEGTWCSAMGVWLRGSLVQCDGCDCEAVWCSNGCGCEAVWCSVTGVATRQSRARAGGSLDTVRWACGCEAVWMGVTARQSVAVQWVWLRGSLDGCDCEAVWCSAMGVAARQSGWV